MGLHKRKQRSNSLNLYFGYIYTLGVLVNMKLVRRALYKNCTPKVIVRRPMRISYAPLNKYRAGYREDIPLISRCKWAICGAPKFNVIYCVTYHRNGRIYLK